MNAYEATFLTISQDDAGITPQNMQEVYRRLSRAAWAEAKKYVAIVSPIAKRLNVVNLRGELIAVDAMINFVIGHKSGHLGMLDLMHDMARHYNADAFWSLAVEIAQVLGYLPSDEPEAVAGDVKVSVESIVALDGDFVAIADATLTAIAPMPFDAAMAFALNVLDALVKRGVRTNRDFSDAEVEFWFLNHLVGQSGADNRFTQSVFDRQKENLVRFKDRAYRLTAKQVRALLKCAVEYWQSGNHPAVAAYAAASLPTLKGVDPVVDRAAEAAMTAAKQGPMRGRVLVKGKVSNAMSVLTKRGYTPRYVTERQGTRTWRELVVDVDGWTHAAVEALERIVTGGPIGWGEYDDGIEGCYLDGGYWNSEEGQDEELF